MGKASGRIHKAMAAELREALAAHGESGTVKYDLLGAFFDGNEEIIKAIVVAVQCQTNYTEWTPAIRRFVTSVARLLERSREVDTSTIDRICDLMEHYGLDPFRGVLSS